MKASNVTRFLKDDVRPYLTRTNKKPLLVQLREACALYREYRYLPYHYFKSYLCARNVPENADLLSFVPPMIIQESLAALNATDREEHRTRIADKAQFQKLMEANQIECVGTIATIDASGGILDHAGNSIDLPTLKAAALRFGQQVFVKPKDAAGGKGAAVIDVGSDAFATIQTLKSFIVQPVIRQHADLNRLFPKSINTLRIDTFLEGGSYTHNAAVVRVGTGDLFVDNWDKGAIAVGVELDTGRLMRTGWRKNKFADQNGFDVHPDTGIRFDGYQLPFWSESKDLVCRAAETLQPMRSLGWDVAITDSGPILVEVNDVWGINLMQTACGGMRDTPIGQYALHSRGLT